MLSIHIRTWCMHWVNASGASVLTCMFSARISFPIFQMLIFYTTASAKGIDAHSEHVFKKLMHALCIRIRNSYLHWAYASRTNNCAERMNQELSIQLIKNLCTHWAYASETYASSEHTHQELMRVLSICTKNLYGCWAYTSVPYAYAQHKRNNSKLEKVPSKHAEHTREELLRALSIHIRNLCVW